MLCVNIALLDLSCLRVDNEIYVFIVGLMERQIRFSSQCGSYIENNRNSTNQWLSLDLMIHINQKYSVFFG